MVGRTSNPDEEKTMFHHTTQDEANRSLHLMASLYTVLTTALLGACVLTLSPALAQEATVGDDDSSVEVHPAEPAFVAPAVESAGTVTLGGDHVVMDDTAEDLFAAGQTVTLRGTITDNAFLAGKDVSLDGGRVEGDLLMAGASATVDGEVIGDVYGFAGEFHITPDAVIHGDVMMGSGELRHEGTILGSLDVGVGTARIDGRIDGDANLEVGELHLGSGAAIGGNLSYEAPQQAQYDDGATVSGEVEFTEVEPSDEDEDDEGVVGFLLGRAWLFFGALIVGSVLLWVGGPTARRFGAALEAHPGRSMGIGFVTMIVVPVAAVLAMALILSFQLGAMTMLMYLVALYVSGLIAAHAVGDLMLRRAFGRTAPSAYAALALGLLLLHVLLPIPYLGFVVRLVAVVAGLGAMWVALRNGNGAAETA